MDTAAERLREPSKHVLSELAIGSAIQLERAIAGLSPNIHVFRDFALALVAVADPAWNDGPFRYVAPGYLLPLESMARRGDKDAGTIEAVQTYAKEIASALSSFGDDLEVPSNPERLRDACLALHHELVQDLMAETLPPIDGQADSRVASARFRPA